MPRCISIAVALLLSAAFLNDAQASIRYILGDHPDGNQSPPPYGLRLDDFTGEDSGVFTWQFTRPDDFDGAWQQAVLDVEDDGTIRIHGNMYGGLNDGTAYDADQVGVVAIDYTYRNGVSIVGDRVVVTDDSGNNAATSNGGTLEDLSGWFTTSGVLPSSTFQFFDKGNDQNISFVFDNDGHRLSGHDLDPATTYVGRGWQHFNDDTMATRDFLFTARLVPEPSSMMIWSIVGLGFAGMRRRRNGNA